MTVKLILIKSPGEWATTKQVCSDELVVYLNFPLHIITITNCRQYCFGLLGLIGAVLMLFMFNKANGSPPVGSVTATRQKDQPATKQWYALNGGAPARQLHRGIEPRPEPM